MQVSRGAFADDGDRLSVRPGGADVDQSKDPYVGAMFGECAPRNEEAKERVADHGPDPGLFKNAGIVALCR